MLGLSSAFFVGSIVATILAVKTKVLKGKKITDTWTDGFSQMVGAVLILILSWAIGNVTSEVGTAAYIVDITKGVITPGIMYIVIFVSACLTAFLTGTSWGTFAIFLPIAVPLAIGSGFPVYPAIGAWIIR